MKTKVLFNLGEENESLFSETENKDYLSKQVIMYSGRKMSMLNFIENEVIKVKNRLKKDKITVLDGFSGTGIVSRLFKKHSSKIYSNDLEYYSMVISQCYLTNNTHIIR